MHNSWKQVLFTALTLILISSCSKKNDDSTSESDNDGSSTDMVQSAASVIGDALNENNVVLFHVPDLSPMAACSTETFSTCSSGVRTRSMNSCTMSNVNSTATATMSGTITLTYSNSSCAMSSTNDYFTRTFTNFYATLSDQSKIITYTGAGTVADESIGTTDLVDYNGTTRSGGTRVTRTGASARSVVIDGIHRRRIRSDGTKGFWHTLFTDSTGLSVTLSSGVATVNGAMTMTFNRLRVTATTTFTNIQYSTDGSCCYPTSGTLEQTYGDTTISTTFNSCGVATIDSAQVTLPACGSATSE